jgi:CRP/FNR family cyclic AMP-dependent transcriptional regulator
MALGDFFGRWLKLWKNRLFLDEDFHQKLKFFRGIFLFRDLADSALVLLAGTAMEKNYAEGEVIFEEGDIGRACFIIAEGRIEIYQNKPAAPSGGNGHGNNNGGLRDKVAVLQPGDFFGEMVLLDELPRSATARCLEPTKLYILYKSQFDGLISDSPRVASMILHNLARLLSARLRRQSAKAADAPGKTLEVK